jgi:prolyl-tRNA editing enzyme YbaK/EbsC (Cys-tRNA(Pro) deacylase)
MRGAKVSAHTEHTTVSQVTTHRDGTMTIDCACGMTLTNGPSWSLDEHIRLHRAEARFLALAQVAPAGIPRLVEWPLRPAAIAPPSTTSDPGQLPARARSVAAALASAGATGQVRLLPESTRTAAAAAAALGCEVGQIANSLVFLADGEPLLVLTSGRHRVDQAALAGRIGVGTIERATPEQVRAATGQAIGGVAPVGHPAPVRTVVDVVLAEYAQVWAAGGTPHTVFPTTFDELVTLTGGAPHPVD